MADMTKDSQPSVIRGQTPTSFPIPGTPPPLGGSEPSSAPSMDEWNMYWRGSVILSLLFGAVMIGSVLNKTLMTGAFILVANLLFYPLFLLCRNVWRNSPMGFFLYVVFLGATPLMICLWASISLFLSRCLLARKYFWGELVIAGAIFFASWSYAVRHPAPATESSSVQESLASTNEEKAIVLTQEQIKRIEAASRPAKQIETKSAPAPSTIGQAQAVEFRDPNGYIRANVPAGFKITDKTQGTRSKIILTYSPDFEVVIIASEMANTVWDPQTELNKKRGAIESGAAGPLSRMEIDSSDLVVFNEFKGYELKLSDGGVQARAYAMAGRGISVSISMVMKNPGAALLADLFKQSLQESLTPRPPSETLKTVAHP